MWVSFGGGNKRSWEIPTTEMICAAFTKGLPAASRRCFSVCTPMAKSVCAQAGAALFWLFIRKLQCPQTGASDSTFLYSQSGACLNNIYPMLLCYIMIQLIRMLTIRFHIIYSTNLLLMQSKVFAGWSVAGSHQSSGQGKFGSGKNIRKSRQAKEKWQQTRPSSVQTSSYLLFQSFSCMLKMHLVSRTPKFRIGAWANR